MPSYEYVISLPVQLRSRAEEFASIQGVSIERFIESAILDRIAQLAAETALLKMN